MALTRCSVDGCGSQAFCRGWCTKHYNRWNRTGSVELAPRVRAKCSDPGCSSVVEAQGLCHRHYARARRSERVAQAKEGRRCEWCEGPIPVERTLRAVFCSVACKSASTAKARNRRWSLAAHYGLTEEKFDELLQRQGGHCAICPTLDPKGRGTWHVDHDHETGEVRGLLCHSCNIGLGNFHDDPALLEAALRYLTQ